MRGRRGARQIGAGHGLHVGCLAEARHHDELQSHMPSANLMATVLDPGDLRLSPRQPLAAHRRSAASLVTAINGGVNGYADRHQRRTGMSVIAAGVSQ